MGTAGDINEQDAIELLITYAFDLLAHTEAQHASIIRTRVRLESYAVHARLGASHVDQRQQVFEAVAGTVRDLSEAVASQGQLLADMGRMVTLLQGKQIKI